MSYLTADALLRELETLGPSALTAKLLGKNSHHLLRGGAPSAVGRWFLDLDGETRLSTLREAQGADYGTGRGLLPFAAKYAPDTLVRLLELEPDAEVADWPASFWEQILTADPGRFAADAIRAFRAMPEGLERFTMGVALDRRRPEEFRDAVHSLAVEILDSGWNTRWAAGWMVQTYGVAALGELLPRVRHAPAGKKDRHDAMRESILEAVGPLGRDELPVYAAILDDDPLGLPLDFLHQLIAWNEPGWQDRTRAVLDRVLRTGQAPGELVPYVQVIPERDVPALAERLWPLLEHKSKPVRDAAADTLGKLPAVDAVPRAAEVLATRKSAVRATAVRLLGHFAEDPAARETLRVRRDVEGDEGVREAILQVLGTDEVANDADPAAGRAAVEKLVARDGDRLKGMPAAWLDENALPPLFYGCEGATPVPPAAVRWLLHRQARHKEMSAAAEARPLFDALDRARSGDFALHVFQGFLGSGQEARDRWALAVAGLLGDGRTLRALTKQIPEWAEHARGKLAEYATGAIALLGTDEALLALDVLSIRYRSRFKNIGAAAAAAFATAAEARGLTTDELGDRVVPTLGFPPDGAPRVVDTGGSGRRVEVRVGLDFKLELADAATHRKVAAWPSTTPAEVRAEMKEVAAALREAAKAQTLRMETQLVRQRRWPAARWRELFLGSALLRPFAVRLVWGDYRGPDGALLNTFRALPDGALTDAHDDTPGFPPGDAAIGPVHPLELDEETLTAWRAHLEDYEVEPPFAQLERPVARVGAELAAARFHPGGTTGATAPVGALTFKSRAEKRGWTRGSVVDAGCVNFYVKRFPGAGVDVFLEVEGMFVGVGMDDTVTLGRLFFVRADSVQVGGYTYDEPRDENDPRLVALGEVPPVAFSEAVGDLKIIVGAGLTGTE